VRAGSRSPGSRGSRHLSRRRSRRSSGSPSGPRHGSRRSTRTRAAGTVTARPCWWSRRSRAGCSWAPSPGAGAGL